MLNIKSVLRVCALSFLLSGCVNTYQSKSEKWANKVLTTSPDSSILMANINGFMLRISPRKVKNIIDDGKWKESTYNTITIDDLIVKIDQNINKTMGINFTKGDASPLNLIDDQNVNLEFCYGKVSKIDYKSYILQKDLNKYISHEKKRFQNIKFNPIRNDAISIAGDYKPMNSMSVHISYVKRKYFNSPILERNISLYDRLRCLKKELRPVF